jgi:DNA polymerase I
MKILVADLSSIAHPIFHMSGNEPDPNHVSTQTIARVRSLAAGYDRTIVCCDSGRSFRHDISPEYKAQRPERNEVLVYQMQLAQETLADDGYTVLSAKGFEADDLIATVCTRLRPEHEVVIATADKDLTQLVGDGVTIYSLTKNVTMDQDGVLAKFGVHPHQMLDWLCLVGDSSDNVKGVPGVGPKRATELLSKHGSLAKLWPLVLGNDAESSGLTPAIHKALGENVAIVDLARQLITLRTDVPIDVDLLAKREPKPLMKEEDSMEQTRRQAK